MSRLGRAGINEKRVDALLALAANATTSGTVVEPVPFFVDPQNSTGNANDNGPGTAQEPLLTIAGLNTRLAFASITAAVTITILGDVKPGDTVAVIGCGGVGSGAIQGAALAGARSVIAIDTNQSKVDRAMKIGATHGCATALDAAFSFLPDLTMGRNCDVVIITVGVLTSEIVEQARSITGKGGVIVLVSVAEQGLESIELNPGVFTFYNIDLRGSVFGSESPRVQIPRLLQLYTDGKLYVDELVTQEYSLDEVQKGYDDLNSGKNVRGVVRF